MNNYWIALEYLQSWEPEKVKLIQNVFMDSFIHDEMFREKFKTGESWLESIIGETILLEDWTTINGSDALCLIKNPNREIYIQVIIEYLQTTEVPFEEKKENWRMVTWLEEKK